MKGYPPKLITILICGLISIIGFSQNAEEIIVFKNVNLIPMTKDTVIANQTVVVQGTKIIQIDNTNNIKLHPDAIVIDGTDKYLMPGLADMHAHYLSDYSRESFFNLFLKNGITTVRLFQSFPNDSVLIWSEKIKNHEMFGPSLFTCGLFFNDPVIPANSMIKTKKNYDFIKLYSFLSKKEFNTTMRVAKKEHVYTIGHVPFLVGLDGVINEGMNEVAHLTELDFELIRYPKFKPLRNQMFGLVYNNWVKDFYSYKNEEEYLQKKAKEIDKIVDKVAEAGMFVNTTLVVTNIINEQLFEKENFLKRPELPYMLKRFMPEYLAGKNTYQLTVNRLMNKNAKLVKGDNGSKFFKMYLDVNKILGKKMNDAGILLLLGSDCPAITVAVVPGYSIHEELQILTQCGLTPYEAIKTGTTNAGIAAKAMTNENNIGTIEVNKQADFILTAKNPLLNVANIKEMTGIMVQGKWLSIKELDTMKITVKANLADALSEVVRNNESVDAVIKKYNEIKTDSIKFYTFLPDPLNDLGYTLIHQKRFEESIAVFKILVQEFPDNWMWIDSLGEAYMKAGNKELAIENYEKSVRLNPDSTSGKAALRKLKRK